MARRRFGPQHSITGESIYVPEDDDAWDRERVAKELEEMRAGTPFSVLKGKTPRADNDDDPANHHPFTRYHRGRTRYDLDAEGIADYLDESKEPEKYRLKRLSWEARASVYRFQREGKSEQAQALALIEGCVGGENIDPDLKKAIANREKDGDAVLRAAEAVAYSVIEGVGLAVMLLSQDLLEEEKKA